MGLKWPDVNLKDGFIILHETKNGERRRVPLSGHALELLRDHAKVRRAGYRPAIPRQDAQEQANRSTQAL